MLRAPRSGKLLQHLPSPRSAISGPRNDRAVVAGSLGEESAGRVRIGTALGVRRRIDKPRDAGQAGSATGAHGAGFQRDVEHRCPDQPFVAQGAAAPSRSASISAWAVGSQVSTMRFAVAGQQCAYCV